MCPSGLTALGVCRWSGMTCRSDRSRRSPSTIRVLNRFRSVNRISCGVSLPHPINIKGHGRLKNNPIKSIKHKHFYLFTFSFSISICCSSLISKAFEDALAGLPSLGQPYTRLPRRIPPGRAFVGLSPFCTATGLTGPSDRSTQEVLQRAPPRVARPSAILCWPAKGVNSTYG